MKTTINGITYDTYYTNSELVAMYSNHQGAYGPWHHVSVLHITPEGNYFAYTQGGLSMAAPTGAEVCINCGKPAWQKITPLTKEGARAWSWYYGQKPGYVVDVEEVM